jgi:phenylacetate-CoA ligase
MYPAIYKTLRGFTSNGRAVQRLLEEMQKSQWLSREELDSIRFGRLQNLVRHAYENIPYYRETYQKHDIHPQDIKSWKDFQSLPMLTKEEVVNNKEKMVWPEMRGKLGVVHTGGSTGMPLHCYVDQSYWQWMQAFEWLGRGWYDVKEGEKIAWIWGAERDMDDRSWKSRIKRNRFLDATYLNPSRMRAFAELLIRWKPAMFLGFPSAVALFAQFLSDNHIKGIRPKLIETTSEKLSRSQRKLLEDVFQCKVADAYGSREIGSITFECEAGNQHVMEGCHLELIDDGRPVPAGEMGEVVLTSLHQYGMPLIRYRIMDMGIYQPHACSCGRGLPSLREVVGRTSAFIVTADGQYTDAVFFEELFQEKPEIARYQIYQPDLEHLEVRLVVRGNAESAWQQKLLENIRVPFGPNMKISLRILDEIPLTTDGKLVTVVSDVLPPISAE